MEFCNYLPDRDWAEIGKEEQSESEDQVDL